MARRAIRWIGGLALCLAAHPAQAQGPTLQSTQAPRRTMAAVRLSDDETVVLDGRLDEAAWSRAVPAANFIQQDPENGQPATEPTDVRIVYDQHSLYIGATCYDSEPDRWLGYQRRRDETLQADDRFMWVIDTYLDARSAYFFETNPSGLMADALRNSSSNNRQWDGIWNEKVRRSEIGWVVEIEIPFSTLNFNPDNDTWGINFQRTIRRKNEETLWSGWLRNQGLNRMTNAGLVTGLHDLSQGHGIDIKPYGLATMESSPGRGDSRLKKDASAGFDIFYSPTPQLRTNLTINTDFAQTEVDQRLVNLTRFPLFFPEKRDFFLDGSTFFDFTTGLDPAGGGGPGGGNNNNVLLPFFSRRIGLDANGNPQKIDVGAKMGGQIGANDVGVLYVRTGREGSVLGEDFAVLRLKRRLLRQSYVGAMYTGRNVRDTAGAPMLHTAGADFLLATSNFRRRQNLSLAGFYLSTTDPVRTGQNAAYGLMVDYPNDVWDTSFLYREVQKNYNAAVGFTPRVGFRRWNPALHFSPRPRDSRVRRYSFGAESNLQLSTAHNAWLNRDWDVTVFQADFQSQESVQIHVLPTYERLDRNFAISRRITLPTGREYSFARYRFQFSMAQRRVVAFSPTVEVGHFYSGTRKRVAADFNVRLRPGVMLFTSAEWNDVDLKEGRFQTRLYRLVPEVQFSPWMSLVNNIQYDTQSAVLGWQSRFRWIVKPGSDLYIVYTHNWLDDPLLGRFSTLDRRAASKILYTHRF